MDRLHLIFYEPYVLFDFGQATTLPDLGDGELGMSFHDYCPTEPATHSRQGATDEALPLENALARSAHTGDALMMTEFGATDDLADLRRVVRLADDHGISWIEWANMPVVSAQSHRDDPGIGRGSRRRSGVPATGAKSTQPNWPC